MKRSIFHILTLVHLRKGFPLYVRSHIRFIALAMYGSLVFCATVSIPPSLFDRLSWFRSPLLAALMCATMASIVGYIFLAGILRRWEIDMQSRQYRARFGILNGMARLSQSAIVLSLSGLIWLWAIEVRGLDASAEICVAVAVCVGVAGGVLALVAALYGWMDSQFDDVEPLL